jgi:quinol monooxygenase YgiN
MKDDFYNLALWKVKNNKQEEFLHIWEIDFASAFIKLNPYSKVTLIQSLENPDIYYSFGAWIDLKEMQSARASDHYRSAISKLVALCTEARPGSFKNVLSISGNK